MVRETERLPVPASLPSGGGGAGGWGLLLLLAACVSPPAEPATTGILRGTLDTAGADAGNGFVFLYPSGEPPPPKGTGRPVQITAVPEPRLFGGSPPNADFTFANLTPLDYLARGVVDERHLFDPFVDVMAQPFAGDVDEPLVGVSAVAGQTGFVHLPEGHVVPWEPPMFVMDTLPDDTEFMLGSTEQVLSILHLTATPLPFSQPDLVAFEFDIPDGGVGPIGIGLGLDGGLSGLGLGGTDGGRGPGHGRGRGGGGGLPFGLNLNSLVDGGFLNSSPQVIIERIPETNDGPEFQDASGNPLTIVLPAVAEPDTTGRNDVIGGQEIVDGMYVFIAPIAEVVTSPDGGGPTTTVQLPSLPLGKYAIIVVESDGRYWELPNGLAPGQPFAANHGGPYVTQATRFEVVP